MAEHGASENQRSNTPAEPRLSGDMPAAQPVYPWSNPEDSLDIGEDARSDSSSDEAGGTDETRGAEDFSSGNTQPRQRRRVASHIITALLAALTTAVITHSAIRYEWVPDVTGTFISLGEFETEIAAAEERAFDLGHTSGMIEGELAGFTDGQDAGYNVGRIDGSASGFSKGYDAGYVDGGTEAWEDGYYEGYTEGWSDGCSSLFEGLGTNRVGDWWDYYYGPSYASYFRPDACS